MGIRTTITEKEIGEMKKELSSLEQAFDLLDVHILITDINGNILYANKAAQKMTGYSMQEMLGKNPGDLWGGHEPNSFYANMWKTIKDDKKPFVGRVRNMNKNGFEYTQELHIIPLLDDRGSAKYFVSMQPDVTMQVRNENQQVKNTQERTNLYNQLMQSERRISDLTKKLIETPTEILKN